MSEYGTSVVVADVLRVVNLVLGGSTLSLSLFVTALYLQQYRRYRRAIAHAGLAPWRGLLPRHVATIGISHVTLTMVSLVDIYLRIHEPLSPRAGVYLLSYVTGLWALWDIVGHTRHRMVDLTPGAGKRVYSTDERG